MTHQTPNDETSATLLAPLARGIMRRAPEILSLSIHDTNGHALWSSGDFLLAEDHALIAEVIEEPYDVRGQSSGLWWESADTARARCALALFEQNRFCGVALLVFSGLTTGEEDRADRVAELQTSLPLLARALHGGGEIAISDGVEASLIMFATATGRTLALIDAPAIDDIDARAAEVRGLIGGGR